MSEHGTPSWNLYVCPACDYHGISGVSGGVGPWPGDGKVRCPSRKCEFSTVMEQKGRLVLVDAEGESTQEPRRPSREEIETGLSQNGGWTRAQLAEWGISWPPPAGWKKKLEREADEETARRARETQTSALKRALGEP